jgi:hypothetical protein
MFETLLFLALGLESQSIGAGKQASVDVRLEYQMPYRMDTQDYIIFPGEGCWSKSTGKKLGPKCEELGYPSEEATPSMNRNMTI